MSRAHHANPEFVPSLRLLLDSEKYALEDVGMMFGVSRERVRQWCERHGIESGTGKPRGSRCARVWNDEENRFAPVSKKEQKRERSAAYWQRLDDQREARRAHLVESHARLVRTLGRQPTRQEWVSAEAPGRAIAKGSTTPFLIGRWRRPGQSSRDALRELCAATCARTQAAP